MKVHAKLDFPDEEKEKYPLLVIFHGVTGHMEEPHIVRTAEAANAIGIASLRVELYGHGKSDGEFGNHTIFHWLTQAMRVIDYAHHLDFVEQIYLAGHSQGGLTALLTAGLMADRIDKLILMSPAMNIYYGAKSGELLGMKFDPDQLPDELRWGMHPEMCISSDYIRAAKILPVADCITAYHNPVLIIHGTKDPAVDFSYGEKLSQQYHSNGNDVSFVPIEGADHCYTHPGELDEMDKAVVYFLQMKK